MIYTHDSVFFAVAGQNAHEVESNQASLHVSGGLSGQIVCRIGIFPCMPTGHHAISCSR